MTNSCNIQSSQVQLKDETFKDCIGSGHAYLTLREDLRSHIKQVQKDINFKNIRFHGILHDLVGVHHGKIKGKNVVNMQNVFKIFDFLISEGLKPFVELSFMPYGLASGKKTIFKYEANVTPPKDYNEWNDLVKTFTTELINRYGLNEILTWKFEVWNEPDMDGFWSSDMEEYFKLYQNTVKTLKAIDKRMIVGGPATSRIMWIRDIIAFCEKTDTPIDFFSTHHYCCDVSLEVGLEHTELSYRGQHTMKQDVQRVHEIINNSKYKGTPIYFTEWNVTPVHEDTCAKDSEFTAVFVLSTLNDVSKYVNGYSFWTLSDVFEESGPSLLPFTGKYGLINIHNIRKPVYYAYKYLNALYPYLLNHDYDNTHISKSFNDNIRILTWNLPEVLEERRAGQDYKFKNEVINRKINLSGLTGNYRIRSWLVDKENGNALTEWRKMASPQYPTEDQIRTLQNNSKPVLLEDKIINTNDEIILQATLSNASFIFFEIEKIA